MGRRAAQATERAKELVFGLAAAWVVVGLAPMLWMSGGWAGAEERADSAAPIVTAAFVGRFCRWAWKRHKALGDVASASAVDASRSRAGR
ncbi:hypothetical protein [Actinacidiphila guanduensis]|uniref:Uncharacterized protein n=1 Tax=Actinacidiphila guanduensis TaxID=310781 RepID=A0A1G9XUG6_9ACTN|nr:hypothetical protein [Actinacidiphila guanduensis]SDN00438.1 hypothetical protein SAMN05216259_102284 [Actinacidiphila guanduensis]